MRARVVKPFLDLVEGVDRAPNEEFDLTPERFEAINARGFGELVVAIELPEAPKPEKKAPKAKKKAEVE